MSNAHDGFDGPGIRSGGRALFARLGARADRPFWIGRGSSPAERVTVHLEGARPSRGELIEGALVYRDVHASTHAIVVSDTTRMEVFYLLQDAAAPVQWRWRVDRAPGLSLQPDGESVILVGGDGAPQLRVEAPGAVDSAGVRHALSTTLDGEEIVFALRPGARVTYPLLVDPIVYVVDWARRSGATPDGRYVVPLAYDSARERVVMFGGGTTSGNGNDTWEWDGTVWTRRAPATSLPRAPRTPWPMTRRARAS
ncbi:MAG: hypothetical protein M5U28_09220 [Sandaracinaceae bacterium]|nr:hypothetical protein [Sandaracinaceae bacterium]